MKIPNFINTKIVDTDGKFTEIWFQIFTVLFTQLQLNLSDEGFIIPQQTSQNIASLNIGKYTGGLLYNSDKDFFEGNTNGVFKQIITSGDQQAANVSNIKFDNTQINNAKISNVGFYGKTPIAQQIGGALTAGASYTANEQDMLNKVFTALRNYGLLS